MKQDGGVVKQITAVFLTGRGVMEKTIVEIIQTRKRKTARCVIPLVTSAVRTDGVYQNVGCVTLMMIVVIILMRMLPNVVSRCHATRMLYMLCFIPLET